MGGGLALACYSEVGEGIFRLGTTEAAGGGGGEGRGRGGGGGGRGVGGSGMRDAAASDPSLPALPCPLRRRSLDALRSRIGDPRWTAIDRTPEASFLTEATGCRSWK